MIKLGDILPLISRNDVRIVDEENEEICLIRNDFRDILSEAFRNAEVTCIDNEEEILNTVNIYIAGVERTEKG